MSNGETPRKSNAVRTVVDVRSEATGAVIPAGTFGVIVESYSDPDVYSVDLGIPSPEWAGGHDWDHVTLYPGQFVFVDRFPDSPYLDRRAPRS